MPIQEALEHIAETFYAGYGGLRLEGVPRIDSADFTPVYRNCSRSCARTSIGTTLVPAPVPKMLTCWVPAAVLSGGNEELAARASQTQSCTATGPHSAARRLGPALARARARG